MLTRLLLFVLLAMPLAASPLTRPHDDASLLAAVAQVEGWTGGVGPHGELYAHQMMPGTYASYTGTPAERAVKHLAWLKHRMRRRGVAPLPFNLAVAWNAGFEATVTGRAPVASYDYARRVVAIMEARR